MSSAETCPRLPTETSLVTANPGGYTVIRVLQDRPRAERLSYFFLFLSVVSVRAVIPQCGVIHAGHSLPSQNGGLWPQTTTENGIDVYYGI